MRPELPDGFNCTSCEAFHRFPAYVFAHWRDVLTHTCECGAKHDIVGGVASLNDIAARNKSIGKSAAA